MSLVEETESMAKRDRQELASRLRVLATHLLKWHAQRGHRSSSWSGTIREQRRQIARQLGNSPSLRPVLDEILAEIYTDAREEAAEETGLSEADFPSSCPFALEDVLSDSFLPE
jgi:ribosomal protein L29